MPHRCPECALVVVVCILSLYSAVAVPQDELNSCLDSKHHKSTPGPEAALYEQCTPWKSHACCTRNTTYHVHTTDMYNFDFDHCRSQNKAVLSPECQRHFVQDLCFYECEPHIGPWKDQVNRSFANERFYKVPLCLSDCQSWFDACRNDYTCVSNWPMNFKFVKGHNICPENSVCNTFTDVYRTAENFCETVWDHSWKVVNDSEPCMRMWFDGRLGNPNKRVAEVEINRRLAAAGGAALSVCSSVLFYIIIYFVFL